MAASAVWIPPPTQDDEHVPFEQKSSHRPYSKANTGRSTAASRSTPSSRKGEHHEVSGLGNPDVFAPDVELEDTVRKGLEVAKGQTPPNVHVEDPLSADVDIGNELSHPPSIPGRKQPSGKAPRATTGVQEDGIRDNIAELTSESLDALAADNEASGAGFEFSFADAEAPKTGRWADSRNALSSVSAGGQAEPRSKSTLAKTKQRRPTIEKDRDPHAFYNNPNRPAWQTQKAALESKFAPSGGHWQPRKKLSPDAVEGIRALHAQYPDQFTTPALAARFEVSPEAIRRILKSKWRPSEEEEEDRRRRWDQRGQQIWSRMVESGVKPPKKWREMGIGRGRGSGGRGGREQGSRGGVGGGTQPGPEGVDGDDLGDRIL